MARYTKTADGKYHIKGKTYEYLCGTRAQVWHGTAYKTSGGLHKTDLMQNKSGRIVSEKKHFTAKKEQRLIKHGYGTKKGKFGFVKIGSKSRRSKKMKGGSNNIVKPMNSMVTESFRKGLQQMRPTKMTAIGTMRTIGTMRR